MSQINIVAGTGHRPDKFGGYNETVKTKLYWIAYTWLKENRPKCVVSGMAQGWDWALATAALNLGIKLICAIPFQGQERMWPAKTQLEYKDILSKADEVIIICSGDYAAWKMQRRNEWMVDYLIDSSNVLLALWDGTPGGTANCIKYFEKKYPGANYVNLYEQFKT